MNQLTIWPERDRGMPNCIARSALFNVDHDRAKRTGEILRDMPIATNRPMKIVYSGEQLRTDDQDVWLQLVHMAREDLSRPVITTSSALIKALGWSNAGGSKDRLIDVIRRLQFTQILVTHDEGKSVYCGSLILNFMSKEQMQRDRTWTLNMDLKLADLFLPHGFTKIDWEIRKQLPPIGKWFQSYLHSFDQGLDYEISFAWLKELMGSKANDKNFRDQVITTMPKLVDKGVIKTWSIEANGKLWPRRR